MARTRMVKPALFSDEKLAKVSIPARYLFVGLLTQADDEGKLINSPQQIAGNLFPLENMSLRKIRGWLGELEHVGVIGAYMAKDTPCLLVRGFARHQKVSHPTPSVLPNPPEGLASHSGDIPPWLGVGVGGELGGGVGVGGTAPPDGGEVPELDDQETYLLSRLYDAGEAWRECSPELIHRFNDTYGVGIVRDALRRAREEHVVPGRPAAWLRTVCADIRAKASA